MAAVTICSDFGAQENKVSHCFHCFPIYLPWSDGTRCHQRPTPVKKDNKADLDRERNQTVMQTWHFLGLKVELGEQDCCHAWPGHSGVDPSARLSHSIWISLGKTWACWDSPLLLMKAMEELTGGGSPHPHSWASSPSLKWNPEFHILSTTVDCCC